MYFYLDPVGRAQGVELEAVVSEGQLLLGGGAGDGAIDVGEPAPTGLLLPLPHIRRSIGTWRYRVDGVDDAQEMERN